LFVSVLVFHLPVITFITKDMDEQKRKDRLSANNSKSIASKKKEFVVGDKILAMWKKEGCLYPAVIQATKEDAYRVLYEFSSEEWIDKDLVFSPDNSELKNLKADTKVYVKYNIVRNQWIPAIVKEVKDDHYRLVFEKKYSCEPDVNHVWAKVDRVILQ
jgi:Domain of unknown function (DUF4537)